MWKWYDLYERLSPEPPWFPCSDLKVKSVLAVQRLQNAREAILHLTADAEA